MTKKFMVQFLAETRGFSLLRGVPGVFPRDEIVHSPTCYQGDGTNAAILLS
jgi:hypothetical protein